MYLKRLEMNGFKSFLDARIVFQQGITAVVGPNGSGKSNILDAVLWVLGEQSTKTLRSERMEDVIFNGTESRKPHGMVEVSLILGDVDQGEAGADTDREPLPYSLGECEEVMVTRRLFRDGVSEYFINQTPCRLKDLRSLLLDTRAGSKGHTVIEQGMIDRLLRASPIERRELIEETAGIIRYKKQKAEALRKLESTAQNLARVRDIVNEVKRQIGGLDRQVKAAEAYKLLKQEVRGLELTVLIHEFQQISDDYRQSEQLLIELHDRESAEHAAAGRFAADIEAVQLEVAEGDAGITKWRDAVGRLEARLSQAATSIELLAQQSRFLEEQRIRAQTDRRQAEEEKFQDSQLIGALASRVEGVNRELSTKMEVLGSEEAALSAAVQRYRDSQAALDAGRARVMDRTMAATVLANQVTNNQARAAELNRRTEKLEQQRIQAEAALEILDKQLGGCFEARRRRELQLRDTLETVSALSGGVDKLKERLSDAEQHVLSIQEELTVATARQRALRAVTREAIQSLDSESPETTVAHVLTVQPEYDLAIEAVLGHKLMGTLVNEPQDAVHFLNALEGRGAGTATFIPRQPRVFSAGVSPLISGEGVIGPALDFVVPRPGFEQLISHLLAGVVIVRSLEQAIALWHAMTESAQGLLVTLNGEILTPDGILTASPVEVAAGVIARERELRTLGDVVQKLEQALREAKENRTVLEHALTADAAVREAREAEVHQLEIDLISERKDEERGHLDIAQLRERIAVLMAERHATEAEREALRATEHTDRNELQRSERERASAEDALVDLQTAVTMNEGVVERHQAIVGEVRLLIAGLTQQLEQSRTEARRMEGVASLRQTRILELEAELSRLQAAVEAAIAERQATEVAVPGVEAELSEARRSLTEAQESQTARTTRLRALEAEFNKLRHTIEDVHRQQEAARLRQREAEVRLEGYEAQLHGTYHVSIEAAIAEVAGNGTLEVESARERLIQQRGRLDELGPVNVMAIEEHRELAERLSFLIAQEEDLAQSVSSLKAIIARINRTTKQLFLNTFQELQSRFDEMFRSFFEGGRAELLLVEDEEGGEPGVDIVAQPPGKRLKNITMLSGGERALTAMALVFASFVIRPTPFCVLDEIDAPLDEENTVRFTRVLQSLSARSQFIVITHSKQTMEVADSLYGVTMEEPGISTLVSVRLNKLLEPV